MSVRQSDRNLANYHLFLSRVDQLCQTISSDYAAEIACKAGCSGCCRHLALFPVEAAQLVAVIEVLPDEVRALLATRSGWPENSPCPLLQDDRCLVYHDRPVICRTHGLPLLAEIDGAAVIDYCPENFRTAGSLPGSAVINLEILNSTLAAINRVFVAETGVARFRDKDRFTIAEIILLSASKEFT